MITRKVCFLAAMVDATGAGAAEVAAVVGATVASDRDRLGLDVTARPRRLLDTRREAIVLTGWAITRRRVAGVDGEMGNESRGMV